MPEPKYVDRPDIPEPLLNALRDPYYEEGLNEHFEQIPESIRKQFKWHFSTTTLPRSPRQRILNYRHIGKVIVDPLTGFWRLLGHITHVILEKHAAKGDIVEQRLGRVTEVTLSNGKKVKVYIHGQLDRYKPKSGVLQDWKMSKAESMLYEDKVEYHAQLNILAWIGRGNGLKYKKLQNVYLFRNHDKRNYKEGGLYPAEVCQVVDVPMWADDKIEKYIHDRARAHIEYNDVDDDELPHCTDSERWKGIPLYKIYKIDPKTGERQLKAKNKDYSKKYLEEWAKEPENAKDAKGNEIKYEILEIPAKPVRCMFCEISGFCGQRKAEIAAELSAEEDESVD